MNQINRFLLKIFRPKKYRRVIAAEAFVNMNEAFVKMNQETCQAYSGLADVTKKAGASIYELGQVLRLLKKPIQKVHSHIPSWARPINQTR